jgi:hypothetical protein
MHFFCFMFVLHIPSSPQSFDDPNKFWLGQPQPTVMVDHAERTGFE